MYDLLLSFRRFMGYKSLRLCNIAGLTLLFACFIISYSYIRDELDYDRFYSHPERIARLSLAFPGKPVDVRIYGDRFDGVIKSIPEIEQTVKLAKINTGELEIGNRKEIINDFYLASANFFDVFDIPLLSESKEQALSTTQQAVVSEEFALRNFGTTDIVGKELKIVSRRLSDDFATYSISGVYKDFPKNAHFSSELLLGTNPKSEIFNHVYLRLTEGVDLNRVKAQLDTGVADFFKQEQTKPSTILMPITDIHLHSNMQREHKVNGNINYLYLLAASCLLLFVIVLFNLWLTSNIVFLRNHPFYRMLHVNGASLRSIFAQELYVALLTGLISVALGSLAVFAAMGYFGTYFTISPAECIVPTLIFLLLMVVVSMLPVMKKFTFSFLAGNDFLPGHKFTYKNARYMIAGQFCIVVFTGVMSLGIGRQMQLINKTQLAADTSNILVFNEKPDSITARYDLFKSELLKHPEISVVCASMQLPGSSILDAMTVSTDNDATGHRIPLLIADNDMFKLYGVRFVAGSTGPVNHGSYPEERDKMYRFFETGVVDETLDSYVLNEKAIAELGFKSPEEALGKRIRIDNEPVAYRNQGVIAGVTENFMYTNVYESVEPLIILQRKPFYNSFAVKYDKRREAQALATIGAVWKEVNPDYFCNYQLLSDRYDDLYAKEGNISLVVSLYSLICLVLANLGLVVFMAFMTKTRNKEIGIRKVNGASVAEILRMLNADFVVYVLVGFVVAVPLSYYVLNNWLQNFAYKANISWYLFALIGAVALCFAFTAAASRAYRAATTNPVKYLKRE